MYKYTGVHNIIYIYKCFEKMYNSLGINNFRKCFKTKKTRSKSIE